MEKFEYSEEDFSLNGCPWPHVDTESSQFDRRLCNGWDKAMKNGHFRYTLEGMDSRVVHGKRGYVIQLNMKRGVERRKPEFINSLNMPFNPSNFNFTKVMQDEILFEFCPKTKASRNTDNGTVKPRHIVMVNVSPLEYGHVLLVPDVDNSIPQRLTERGLKLSIDLILLSKHPGFRVGFNSLCALASVNHQHVHGWYLNHSVQIEYVPVDHLMGPVYELTSLPSKGFAFQLHKNDISELVRTIYIILKYFQDNEIAHNLFITRGPQFGEDKDSQQRTVRIYLWPRKSVVGVKHENGLNVFNVAVAELAGHIPVYVPDRYPELSESDIDKEIASHMLPEEDYSKIRLQIKTLLQSC